MNETKPMGETETREVLAEHSPSIGALAQALAKAQAELTNVTFESENPHFRSRYASLAAILDVVRPVLSRHGIAVVQLLSSDRPQTVTCKTMLVHTSGEWIAGSLTMPVGKKPIKVKEGGAERTVYVDPDAQAYGSAATYARRYSLAAICAVTGDDDDDANRASGRVEPDRSHRVQAAPDPRKAKAAQFIRDIGMTPEMVNRLKAHARAAGADPVEAMLEAKRVGCETPLEAQAYLTDGVLPRAAYDAPEPEPEPAPHDPFADDAPPAPVQDEGDVQDAALIIVPETFPRSKRKY